MVAFTSLLTMNSVNIALPTMQHEFGVDPGAAQWIVLAYQLPLIALVLPSGRWLDRVGTRPALALAVGGFALMSLAGAASGDFALLLAVRIAQGCFGALMLALTPALAARAVRPEARARAMSVLATLAPLGALTGPALGGVLLEISGWPAVFLLNTPICLLVLAIGLHAIPADRPLRWPDRSWLAEAALVAGAVSAVLLGVTFAARDGLPWLALSLLAVPLFLVWRRRSTSVAVLELLRRPGMAGPHLTLLAVGLAFAAMNLILPFYLQRVLHADPSTTGLTILAFPVGMALAGPLGGLLGDRWGARRTGLLGVAVVAAGLLLVLPLDESWQPFDLGWRLFAAGLGMGLYGGPVQSLAMGAAPRSQIATTSATVQLARSIGFALGPALATTLWAMSGYTLPGMRLALGLAVLAAVAALPALLSVRPKVLTAVG
ncbi:MFS transporter [Crossiella sp. CA198]|uniref:MFS transporter n=1 Tax=Crossiella sp. CA198 TaxID=3455607 RepID=UPI003F8D4BA0